jgi:hypothetical protein
MSLRALEPGLDVGPPAHQETAASRAALYAFTMDKHLHYDNTTFEKSCATATVAHAAPWEALGELSE